MNKFFLRTKAKNLRNTINMTDISLEICQKISDWNFFQKSKNILAYYPLQNEIDLRTLFEMKFKNWYLPRVAEDFKNLIIHNYSYDNTLFANKWGVLEPSKNLPEADLNNIDLVIIPALMVDKKGHRLGYGAGFYDRFLKKLPPNCIKVVPVIQDLFVENLPSDTWDIPVDYIITPQEIFKI